MITWTKLGQRCHHREWTEDDDEEPTGHQCSAPIASFWVMQGELVDEGPQGAGKCTAGHQRWIWPGECSDRQQVLFGSPD